MRNSTKLKKLLENNTVELSVNGKGLFVAMITCNYNGNSTISKAVNFTDLINQLLRDAKFLS